MTKEIQEEVLLELGFSKNEAKVYLALLSLGSSTAGEIAKVSNVHRTNVYDALEGLVKKGVISYINRKDIKYYEANNPDNLMNILKNKENRLRDILPEFKVIEQCSNKKNDAQILEGASAFMNILYDFLKYNKTIYSYGIPKVAPEILRTKIPHFHKERLAKKITMYHIYNYNAIDRINFLNQMEFTKAGFMNETIESLVSTNICGPEVVLVIWSKEIKIVRIVDEDIAEAYREYFKLHWKNVKK